MLSIPDKCLPDSYEPVPADTTIFKDNDRGVLICERKKRKSWLF